MDPLDRLTRRVARTIGDGPEPGRRARQRRAVARLTVRPEFDRRWWWIVPLGAAAVLVMAWARPRPVVGPTIAAGRGEAATAGAWLVAGDAEIPVVFADRSRVVVAPRGAARVGTVEAGRVEVTLERGRIDVAVVEDPGRVFRVTAGPFEVVVTGTEFSVEWQPAATTVTVAVTDGAVVVRGGSLGESGTAVAAGERVVASAGAGGVRAERETTNAAGEREVVNAGAERGATNVAGERAVNAGRGGAGWRELADAGEHAGALAAAERAGFAALLERLDAEDLERLAHSARLAGAAGPAREALQTLRRRFPGDARAATATFLLGRVAIDLSGDARAAVAWFAAYVAAAPDGPLAAEARGRRMQLLGELGEGGEARAAAEEYLRRHADGSRAALAREILGRR